jgi:hypothetical protein
MQFNELVYVKSTKSIGLDLSQQCLLGCVQHRPELIVHRSSLGSNW